LLVDSRRDIGQLLLRCPNVGHRATAPALLQRRHRATAPALPQLGHPCPRHALDVAGL